MADEIEGFLCPECMANFISKDTLMTHFETTHEPPNAKTEQNIFVMAPKQLVSPPVLTNLIGDYERLVLDYSNRNREMDQEIQTLSLKTSILESVMESIVTGSLASTDLSQVEVSLRKKLEAYSKQEKDLRQTLAPYESAMEEFRQLKAKLIASTEEGCAIRELQESKSRILELESCLKEITEINSGKDLTITRLELRVDELEAKFSESQSIIRNSETKLSQPQDRVDSLKHECSVKDEQIANLKTTSNDFQLQMAKSYAVFQTFQSSSKESVDENQSSDSGEHQINQRTLKQLSENLMDLQTERRKHLGEINELQDRLKASVSEKNETVKKLNQQISSLSNQVEQYKNKSAQLVSQEAELGDSLNKEISRLTIKCTELETTAKEKEIRSKQREKATTELCDSRLATKCLEMETAMQEREANFKMEHERSLADVSKLRESSTNQISKLQCDLKSKALKEETLTQMIAELETKISQLNDQVKNVEAEIILSKEKLQKSEQSNSDLIAEVSKLNRLLNNAESDASEKEIMYKSQVEASKQLTHDLDALTSECKHLADQLKQAQSETTKHTASASRLKLEVAKLQEEVIRLTTSETALQAELTIQENLSSAHNSTLLELQARLEATLMQQQTLMDKFIASENKSTQLETALGMCHQELESLQRIVLDLGRQNQTLQIAQERLSNRQWVDDDSAASCSNCQKEFSLSLRKHHCRRCGDVFCSTCSMKKAPTPASKTPLRVCDACFTELTGA